MGTDGLDDRERAINRAAVLDFRRSKRPGYNSPSWDLDLEGDITVICKTADETPSGERSVTNEVAARELAKGLGWTDLVSATVLRHLPSFIRDGETIASLQEYWPWVADTPPIDSIPDEQAWRAAVFDVLIDMTDRGSYNWIGVDHADGLHLALIDHGFAFGHPGDRQFDSIFEEAKRDQQLPDDVAAAVHAWLETGQRPGFARSSDRPNSTR
jgi:hypothetical protein